MKKILIMALIASSFTLQAAVTRSSSPAVAIPDNSCTGANGAGGTTDTITFAEVGTISDVDVSVDITHTWRGDLQFGLEYNATTVILANNHDGSGDNYFALFDDGAAAACFDVANCGTAANCVDIATRSTCQPDAALSAFNGVASNLGAWSLNVCDSANSDVGTLDSWAITLQGQPGDGLPVELMNLSVD